MNNKRRNILLALLIILFIYFEIHSCSEDSLTTPEAGPASPEDIVFNANGVYFHDVDTGWIVGQEGTVARTTNGGRTWVSSIIDSVELLDVTFLDANLGWIVGRKGTIYRSEDGGSNWIHVEFNGFPDDDDLYKVEFMNPTLGFVLGHQGVYRTEDGGVGWINNWIPNDPCRGAWDLSVIDSQNLYLLGTRWDLPDPEVLYRSLDGGLSWQTVKGTNVSQLRNILTIDFVDSSTGWGGGGVILKTEDGGSSWISQIGIAEVRRFFFLDASNGFAIGNDKLIRTEDGGNTWSEIIAGDERIMDLRDIFFLDDNNGWVVGRGIEEVIAGQTFKQSVFMRTGDAGYNWEIDELSWKID